MRKYYLLVSDFDQTLSFNDSGLVLAEMLGIPDFQERVANLSRLNLVQSGAELTYLLRHDPDIRGMLHVNRGEGLTIAASETRHIAQIARRTVISDDALSVLIPVREEIGGYDPSQIRLVFEEQGLLIQEWDRVRTDWLTIRDGSAIAGAA